MVVAILRVPIGRKVDEELLLFLNGLRCLFEALGQVFKLLLECLFLVFFQAL